MRSSSGLLMQIEASFRKLAFLFKPARYKVAHGGRGSGKSWSFARALILLAAQSRCASCVAVKCRSRLKTRCTGS